MRAKLKNEHGETVSCLCDEKTKDAVWSLVSKFFLEGQYTDECIHQCDSAQIDGLELLVKIAKKLKVQVMEGANE